MADFAPVLNLPMELLCEISKFCIQYDWPEGPNVENVGHAGSLCDYTTDDNPYPAPWLNVTEASNKTIFNLRRVCQIFRHASWQSLGTIIGNRPFN